ncbi:PP2C family protein-serine/threonine phosphatase [Streptomyces sp. NBC_01353]|uniref:PP2C family protein-serine/threonine phosphatase n=1 Tax=Streptomyces sp. NBC_01353 TaxID=2903835 RepID=UPI002E33566A|nr:PP2C family protein-serine/threonine phosphatase [Streptomyces sp. NBC_01353]
MLLELTIDDRTVRLIPLLILLPAFPAMVGTVRQTACAVGWVLIVITAVLMYRPLPSSYDYGIVMVLACVLGVLCVVTCHWRIRRERELLRVRSTAVALQRQMLRPLPILTDRVIVDGLYLPVEADRLVGGDVYEVVASPYGTRLLFGDVQGKGLPAIGTAFAVLSAFREAAMREPTLTALVDNLEQAVVRHNAFAQQAGEPERFVTALVLGIDTSAETQAVNCGHLPPYLLKAAPVAPVPLGDPGVPLGVADLSAEPRTVAWFPFPPGATLISCSDGVTEARDATGAFHPLAERLGGLGEHLPLGSRRSPERRPQPPHRRRTPGRHHRARGPQDGLNDRSPQAPDTRLGGTHYDERRPSRTCRGRHRRLSRLRAGPALRPSGGPTAPDRSPRRLRLRLHQQVQRTPVA